MLLAKNLSIPEKFYSENVKNLVFTLVKVTKIAFVKNFFSFLVCSDVFAWNSFYSSWIILLSTSVSVHGALLISELQDTKG